jgi:hypothetical protein
MSTRPPALAASIARTLTLTAVALAPAVHADTWTTHGANTPTVDGGDVVLSVHVDSAFTVSDVNVITHLDHVSGLQLSASLVHPDGTAVPLYDRPTGTSMVFGCFDDEAAAPLAGAGPYSGSYQPLGSLAAFDGKPALGTWSLVVHDELGGGEGVVQGCSLGFNGRTYVAPTTHAPILDFETTAVPLTVSDDFLVGDVDVIFSVAHSFVHDLRVELRAQGTKDTIMGGYSNNCCWIDSIPIVLDDESPHDMPPSSSGFPDSGRIKPFHPFELGVWTGGPSQGPWVLSIHDYQWGDEGALQGWALHLTEGPVCDSASWSVNKTGVAGALGTPDLDLSAPPILGVSFDLTVENVSGVNAPAVLFLGLEPAAVAGLGGTVWVLPLIEIPLLLPPGGLLLPISIPNDPAFCGLPILAQLLHADAAAPKGVAMSQRLAVLPGSY